MVAAQLGIMPWLLFLAAAASAVAGEESPPGPPTTAAAPAPATEPAAEPPVPPRKDGRYEAGARKFLELGLPDTSKCRLIAITGPGWSPSEGVWLIEEDAATGALRVWTSNFTVLTAPKAAAGLSPEEQARSYTRYREVDVKALAGKYGKEKLDNVKSQAANRFFFAATLYARDLPDEADAMIERIFKAHERGDEYERKERPELVAGFYAELGMRLWRGVLEGLGRDCDWKRAGGEARKLAGRFQAWDGSARIKELAEAMERTAARGADYLPDAAAGLPEDMKKLLRELSGMPGSSRTAEPSVVRAGERTGPNSSGFRDASARLAAMGLAAFPALLAVVDDDTCCLAGLPGGGDSDVNMTIASRWRGSDEPLPAPRTRGELAWQIMQHTMPRGGSRVHYGGDEAARPDAATLRAWYDEHKSLGAEKMNLMYLAEGDPGQMMVAVRALYAADKTKYRDAMRDAFMALDDWQRLSLLDELARLDRDLAVPMIQELAAGSEKWEADQAKKLLRRLKVKPPETPKESESKDPAGNAPGGGDKDGAGEDGGEEAVPEAPAPAPENGRTQ